MQSKSFRMDGTFKPHDENNMRLRVDDSQQIVYIVDKNETKGISVRSWSLENNLEEFPSPHKMVDWLLKTVEMNNF